MDQGAVLTRSKIDLDSSLVRDFCPILTHPSRADSRILLTVKEDGSDESTLEKLALFAVMTDSSIGPGLGIERNGRVLNRVNLIPPVQCLDDEGFDQLSRIVASDGTRFRAFGPGHLELYYEGLSPAGRAKFSSISAEDGGGLAIDGPPKDQNKLAVPSVVLDGEPSNPNYVTVSVFDIASGGWRENTASRPPEHSCAPPDLVELLPYVGQGGNLAVKIEWTSSSPPTISVGTFSEDSVKTRPIPLNAAQHSRRGYVRFCIDRRRWSTSITIPWSRDRP